MEIKFRRQFKAILAKFVGQINLTYLKFKKPNLPSKSKILVSAPILFVV